MVKADSADGYHYFHFGVSTTEFPDEPLAKFNQRPEREIPMTNNIDPLTVLATDADVAGWMNEASSRSSFFDNGMGMMS